MFQTMSCVVPGCKTGYGTKKKFPPGVGKHRFPKDPCLRETWIKAIPRSDWMPSSHSVICSLHFEKSDFKAERTDTNAQRQRGGLKTRQLKKIAVPRIFPGCPAYLSKPKAQERSEKAGSSFRRQLQVNQAEEDARNYLDADLISSFEDLLVSPPNDFPSTWNITTFKNIPEKIVFEDVGFDEDGKAHIKFCLIVLGDLSFKMFLKDVVVPSGRVNHITSKEHITRASDVSNILAFLNTSCEEPLPVNEVIEDSVVKLSKFCEEHEETYPDLIEKIQFITEQLRLCKSSKHGRKYSTKFILAALQWMKTSPALYRLMLEEDVLTLPSMSYLQRLSSAYNLETGLTSSTVAYLSEWAKHLTKEEKTVAVLIDEVKIEFHLVRLSAHLVVYRHFSVLINQNYNFLKF